MNKKDIAAFKELVKDLRVEYADPYDSNYCYSEGHDDGRESAADDIEFLLKKLKKDAK